MTNNQFIPHKKLTKIGPDNMPFLEIPIPIFLSYNILEREHRDMMDA